MGGPAELQRCSVLFIVLQLLGKRLGCYASGTKPTCTPNTNVARHDFTRKHAQSNVRCKKQDDTSDIRVLELPHFFNIRNFDSLQNELSNSIARLDCTKSKESVRQENRERYNDKQSNKRKIYTS